MNKCHPYIEQMYQNERVNYLLSKIKPQDLQEDLKQELVLVLLNYNCKKLIQIQKEGNLIKFTLGVLWKMATGTKGEFYKKYKTNNLEFISELYEYSETNTDSSDLANHANNKLDEKLRLSANDAHESIIFKKYVELKSCKKVADYFNIPKKHVFLVVKKTKEELKETIKSKLDE